ncbi:MAG: ORF6N domain-containing protein [Elusimicrobia bacterium]|nr:ORF6N domain-containing protein [Elusimicrobiota bacterium]
MDSLIPIEHIERRIYLIRGHKVMLDRDLAVLYGVETFNLNKTVKRNRERFPFSGRTTEPKGIIGPVQILPPPMPSPLVLEPLQIHLPPLERVLQRLLVPRPQ